jgi:hypothetical protein
MEFGDTYEYLEPADLIDLIVATGDWLEKLVGLDAADATMKTLYHALVPRSRRDDDAAETAGWRPLWADGIDSIDLAELDAAQRLTDLNAFAFWGLPTIDHGSAAEREAEIARTIRESRALLDATPSGWANLRIIGATVHAAEARFSLDHGVGITPEQLAALARVSLKSIKNLLVPSSGSGVSLDADGQILAAAALAWLNGRDGFKSSVWHEELDVDEDAAPEDLGAVVFVPQACDGSWFDPRTCRRTGHYTIGPKGAERAVGDYDEALRQLARMPVPYWRRPNSAGHWSIVAGKTAWLRKPASDLVLD